MRAERHTRFGQANARSRALAIAMAFVLPSSTALGQAATDCLDAAPVGGLARIQWSAPLDAIVSLTVRSTLRDALDRVGSESGVPLAYSSDLVPLSRQVCVAAHAQPLGRVLGALLTGTGVEAIVVGGRVVLSPAARSPEPLTRRASMLERVIVTGSAIAAPRRALTMSVDVIDGERLRREGHTSLSSALDAVVPGLWMWESSPGSLMAQYGGVRGASSFATSYPKIYIDGVEVANPLLITQLDPELVDRIEVIRGPQGSALYGSDAISGVVNILTRHLGADGEGARVQVSSMAGASASAFGQGPVPSHQQRLTLRAGNGLRSAGVSMQFGQTGAVIPASQSRTLSIGADARAVMESATLSATARLFDKRAGIGRNPLLPAGLTDPAMETNALLSGSNTIDGSQAVRLYTLASSAMFASGGRWTHTVLAGLDGYQLENVADASSPYLTGVDSALRAAHGGGDRGTLRASSVARLGGPVLSTTLTLSIEHSVLWQSTIATATPAVALLSTGGTYRGTSTWTHNSGMLAQVSSSWMNALHLTGGLRVEQNDAFSGRDRRPLLPLLGAAFVHSFGGVEVKVRSSFGRGIRPPNSPLRGAFTSRPGGFGSSDAPSGLDPEVQTGFESGVEMYVGQGLSLHATRFDQRATGLIQNVLVGMDSEARAGLGSRRMRYQLENVGEISNRGWELQGTLQRGALGLSGAFATVDSRVLTVSGGYLGDLRPGDRMLAVPARTASLSAWWTAARWSASMTASRASDWVNYDRVALARAYAAADGAATRDVMGVRLRDFWRAYDGQIHLRVSATRDLGRGVTLVGTGENLLGGQLGEPDNLAIRAGRALTGGFRASF